MPTEEMRNALGAADFGSLTIGRLSATAAGADLQVVLAHVKDLLEHPKYVARGPSGARLITKAEYVALRAAGAVDKTPWE